MTIADEPGDGPDPRRRGGASPHDPSGDGAAGPATPGPASPAGEGQAEPVGHRPGVPDGDSAPGAGSDGPAALDYDARFADIVARWSEQPSDALSGTDLPAQRPGAAEGVRPIDSDGSVAPGDAAGAQEAGSDAPDVGEGGAENTDPGVNPPLSPAVPWRQHTPPPEPEEDFRPAAPAPLPRGDLGFWGALLGVTLGPLWLIYLVVTNPYGSRLEIGLALVMAVGGFALIVARLPRRHRDDDEDDGAVV